METLSLRSKSPSAYSVDNNAWASPVEKEALELSNRKRNAVLNMIGKRLFDCLILKPLAPALC